MQKVAAAIEDVVRIGLPVLVGLLFVILIISYVDRHSRKRKPPTSSDRKGPDGRRPFLHGNGNGDGDGDGP